MASLGREVQRGNTSCRCTHSKQVSPGGECYTPPEVSELLARLTVIGTTRVNRVYETLIPRRIQMRTNCDLAA